MLLLLFVFFFCLLGDSSWLSLFPDSFVPPIAYWLHGHWWGRWSGILRISVRFYPIKFLPYRSENMKPNYIYRLLNIHISRLRLFEAEIFCSLNGFIWLDLSSLFDFLSFNLKLCTYRSECSHCFISLKYIIFMLFQSADKGQVSLAHLWQRRRQPYRPEGALSSR